MAFVRVILSIFSNSLPAGIPTAILDKIIPSSDFFIFSEMYSTVISPSIEEGIAKTISYIFSLFILSISSFIFSLSGVFPSIGFMSPSSAWYLPEKLIDSSINS
jgi:hypothetical protein